MGIEDDASETACRIVRDQGEEICTAYTSTPWINSGPLLTIVIFEDQVGGRSDNSPPEGSAKARKRRRRSVREGDIGSLGIRHVAQKDAGVVRAR